MKYKQVVLNRDYNGILYFSEHNLPYDREDEGERIFINTATIYRKSSSKKWKKKMVEDFKMQTKLEIEKLECILKDLESVVWQ